MEKLRQQFAVMAAASFFAIIQLVSVSSPKLGTRLAILLFTMALPLSVGGYLCSEYFYGSNAKPWWVMQVFLCVVAAMFTAGIGDLLFGFGQLYGIVFPLIGVLTVIFVAWCSDFGTRR